MKYRYNKLLLITLLLGLSLKGISQNGSDDNKYFSPKIVNQIEDPSHNLNLYWDDFLVTIRDYNIWSDINFSNYDKITEPFVDWAIDQGTVIMDSTTFYYAIKTDSISIYQEVSSDNIEGKTIKINPIEKDKNTTFKVSVGVIETITQFLSLEEYSKDGMEDQIADLEIWERTSPYKAIKDSAQFYFLIPDRDSISDIEQIKVDLALADTTLYYEAEGGGHDVNYIYKGKPAEHRIRAMIIRIDKFERDVLIETRYIQCRFPEAC